MRNNGKKYGTYTYFYKTIFYFFIKMQNELGYHPFVIELNYK